MNERANALELASIFERDGQTVAPTERRQLAAHVLGRTTAWVYAHDDHRPDPPTAERLGTLLRRRAAGEPLAYLVGTREFFGREFEVTPDVLIPRPETEHLVETALALSLPEQARVIDVGCGSGCIALTLAAERPDWRILATDLSEAALNVADHNRRRLGLTEVRLHRADLLDGLEGPFDAILSNPPYVAAGDPHLDQGDLRHEPRSALTDEQDGLALIRRLIEQASTRLVPGGWLWMEHGHDQATQVRDLLAAAGFERVQSRRDLAGIERISGGRWPQD